MLRLAFIFLTCVVSSCMAACPILATSHPCTCYPERYLHSVTCSNLDTELDFVTAIKPFKSLRYMYSFTINSTTLNFIPSAAFSGTTFARIHITNSRILSLSDTESAFVGLEDHLQHLHITNCSYMNQLDWSVLNNLRKLSGLVISEGDLESIDDMERVNITLEYATFSHSNIEYIDELAFANFSELKLFVLKHNDIEVLTRSMLPDPAEKLSVIDISYNKIKNLPKDMFRNMPSLEFLLISYNRILTLEEKTFAPILKKLRYFEALGIDLICDCRLKWMKTHYLWMMDIWLRCEHPNELRGKNFMFVSHEDLHCSYRHPLSVRF